MFREQLSLRLGPFSVVLTTDIPEVRSGIDLLYPGRRLDATPAFADFHVGVTRAGGLRRWIRPQAIFDFDGYEPFKPLPLDQGLPMFEWGLNNVIGNTAHQYLFVHAGAIERNGKVALLPGEPGAGKSTLTAALVHRGWRLLSDELAMIRFEDRQVVPLARPINLKNASIGLIRALVPEAVFSPEVSDTVKGTVALLRPPADSVARVAETAPPRWIVFPSWRADATAQLEPVPKAEAFITVVRNATNYDLHEARGFELLASVVEDCRCFQFTYRDFDDAIRAFDELAAAA